MNTASHATRLIFQKAKPVLVAVEVAGVVCGDTNLFVPAASRGVVVLRRLIRGYARVGRTGCFLMFDGPQRQERAALYK